LQPETFLCSGSSGQLDDNTAVDSAGEGESEIGAGKGQGSNGAACDEQRQSIGCKRFIDGSSSSSINDKTIAALQGALAVYTMHCSSLHDNSCGDGVSNAPETNSADQDTAALVAVNKRSWVIGPDSVVSPSDGLAAGCRGSLQLQRLLGSEAAATGYLRNVSLYFT
jgi:hypothetical protein